MLLYLERQHRCCGVTFDRGTWCDLPLTALFEARKLPTPCLLASTTLAAEAVIQAGPESAEPACAIK